MAKTSVALYRRGNANSPRMDNVRLDKDIATYQKHGAIWVKETTGSLESGGISTFSVQGRGKNWWKIDAGIEIHPDLELINDRGNHWLWKPSKTMPLIRYIEALQIVNQSFYKVS
ncbi:MAG: hypothetical protein KME09_07365 [Pleurocapsa minor HA4230-MV1]|jgi:hypothetical protein|nr:hypothetical protein [Pleurocapsa minor HA4230-MV1]